MQIDDVTLADRRLVFDIELWLSANKKDLSPKNSRSFSHKKKYIKSDKHFATKKCSKMSKYSDFLKKINIWERIPFEMKKKFFHSSKYSMTKVIGSFRRSGMELRCFKFYSVKTVLLQLYLLEKVIYFFTVHALRFSTPTSRFYQRYCAEQPMMQISSFLWRKGTSQGPHWSCFTYQSTLSGAHADIEVRPYVIGAAIGMFILHE